MHYATTVSSKTDLENIQRLQQQNLPGKLTTDEIQSQGFVTLVHTLEVLEQLNSLCPSVIIKEEDELAGYALVMTVQARQLVPALEPMFQLLDNLYYHNRLVKDYRYYVMGQICIAKQFRGKGLFDELYRKHKELYQDTFDFVITEISTRNYRSLRAHERVGFNTIYTHRDQLDEWAVVIWDWSGRIVQ